MKRKSLLERVAYVVAAMLIFSLATVSPLHADYSTSGVVGGPHPYTYTVQCNPGDSFKVVVTSDHPTSVNILAITPDSRAQGGWAVNSVAASRQNTSHSLQYTAPSGKPTNNASHWHYRVSILASTNNRTNFSLKIEQHGSGAPRSDAFVQQATKQLQALAKSMGNERDRLTAEINSRSESLKSMMEQQKRTKERLDREHAELLGMTETIKSERNKAVRSSMVEAFRQRKSRFDVDVAAYRQVSGTYKVLYDENQLLREQRKNLNDLGNAINEAWQRKDFDRCVLIANGSGIASNLGWKTMKR